MYRNNLGDQIRDIVQDAVDSCNFGDLNRKIKNTADRAIDEFNRATGPFQYDNRRNNQGGVPPFMGGGPNPGGPNGQGQPFGQGGQGQPFGRRQRPPFQNYRAGGYRSREYRNRGPVENQTQATSMQQRFRAKRKAVGNVSSILYIVFGTIGVVGFGIASIVMFAVWMGTGAGVYAATALSILSSVFGVATLGFAAMLGLGIHKKNRIKRFHMYESLLGTKNYSEIERMAEYIGKSKKYVIKDLRKMMLLGFFKEGHIDDTKTCFISDNETYEQYLIAQESYKQRIKEEEKQDKKKDGLDPEVAKAIEEGKAYIRQINQANEDIPGEEISRKLYRLEDVVSKIFVCVEKHPEKLPEIRKFMEYYLPITLKLVNAYKEFDAQPIQGDNITSSKKEIEATIDTINTAFEKLLDSLYEDEAMEVSSDISVLNTLFAQEGLTKKDFDIK